MSNLSAFLDHPVVAVGRAGALFVALVNGGPQVDPQPPELGVRHREAVDSGAAMLFSLDLAGRLTATTERGVGRDNYVC